MKNLFAILAMASIVALGGCKKGEEDPFLSFSSRDSRLEGTWTLSSGTMEVTALYKNAAPGSTASNTTIASNTYALDGTNAEYKYEQTINDNPVDEATYTLGFAIEMTFSKDGTYTSVFKGQVIGTNGTPKDKDITSTGTWSWKDYGKNKAGISLVQAGGAMEEDFITGDFRLKKLSGSEMTLVKNEVYSTLDKTNTSEETNEITTNAEFLMTKG